MQLSVGSLIFLKLLHSLSSNQCKNCTEKAQIGVLNQIIGAANAQRRIDTLVYFGSEASIQRFIAPIMSGTPKVVLTQSCKLNLEKLADHFSRKIFFLAFGKLSGAKKWQFMFSALENMRRHVRGIFVAPYQPSSSFEEHFQWCWRSGFLRVIALVEPPIVRKNEASVAPIPFRLFTYTPFPTLNYTELPLESAGKERFFSNRISDFRGYKMRTALQFDPPRVFHVDYGSAEKRKNFIGGYSARSYQEFLKYHNGLLEIVPKSNLSAGNILSVIRQLNNGEADLSMNVYFNFPGLLTSYPLDMTRWCILLPSSGTIPAYATFLRPFQFYTWLAYAAMLIFLSFAAAINEYINSKVRLPSGCVRFGFGRAFLETLRLVLFVSTPTIYRSFKLHYAFNYTLVSLFGFILSNYYLAVLTSFRARIILDHQIDTMQEMVDRNISINAIEHEIPLVLKNRGLPKGFAELLRPRGFNDFIFDILRLRGGQAYLVREDTIKFVMMQQKDDLPPKFHAAKECITTIPVGYLMPSHSQFKSVLDLFTLQVAAAGLLQRWYKITTLDGFRSGLLTYTKRVGHAEEPLTLSHFQFAFLIIFIGKFLALLSFALEQHSRFNVKISMQFKDSKKKRIRFSN